MLNLGTVKPGSTIYVPFDTFASATGAPITMTNFAVGDVKIYKNGGTTERASTSGFTLLDTDGVDFDGITGIQGFSVDLADNTTSGFYVAGASYFIVISTVTIDSQTVSFVAATFNIGYAGSALDTTIASLSSQTSFTLTAGPAEDDALNGQWAIIHDVASAVQTARVLILDYTGSTKTVTLAAGATFTAAAGDNISIMGPAPLQPTTLGRTLDITASGAAGIDWGNVENQTTTVALTNTSILYLRNQPLRIYVARHGVAGADGLTPGTPVPLWQDATDIGANYPGAILTVYPGNYTDTGDAPNLFTKESYTQFAGLTESGGGANTRFTVAGDGSENYDTDGHANYMVGSQMTPTTGAAAGTLYRITSASYVGPDWEFSVTPNFGGNYVSRISGKTLVVTRERVKTGLGIECLGPVVVDFETLLNVGGVHVSLGEGSIVRGDPEFGLIGKPTGTGLQSFMGQYTSINNLLNNSIYGSMNYAIYNVGQRNDAGDESDGWYDDSVRSSGYAATSVNGSANCHWRANWDAGRTTASNKQVFSVGCSYIVKGPTALSGSNGESRGFAMTAGTHFAVNTDFITTDGDTLTTGYHQAGGTTIAGPGCRFIASSATGTVKKIVITGGTFVNATGQTIAAGDRTVSGGATYTEADIESRDESTHARFPMTLADARTVYARTIPAPSIDGVMPVDVTKIEGASPGTSIRSYQGLAAANLDDQLEAIDDAASSGPTAAEIAQALGSAANLNIYTPATGSTLDIFRGDAYESDEGTEIPITKAASETHWPGTLSTVHFSCVPTDELLARQSGATGLTEIACTVVDASGSDQSFSLELTAVNTASLTVGDGVSEDGANGYNFWFIANKATYPKTLRSGRMNVRKDRTA